MGMSGERPSKWDVRFRHNRDTVRGTWEKRWWHWVSRHPSVSRCILHGLDIWFEECSEQVHYLKTIGQLGFDTPQLMMSEVPAATDLVQFQQPLQFFYVLLDWVY